MKKTLLFIGLIATLVGFSGCTKEETVYRDYYYNTLKIVYAEVNGRHWQFDEDEQHYSYTMSIPELNSSVLRDGNVNVFLQYGSDNSPDLYPLPDIKTYDSENGPYTETISFELYSPKTIKFKIESSDLLYFDPTSMVFKIIITNP